MLGFFDKNGILQSFARSQIIKPGCNIIFTYKCFEFWYIKNGKITKRCYYFILDGTRG